MNKRDTILIVDDGEVNRAILRTVFEKDYRVMEAENGEQAMVLIKNHHRQIACILLDLMMPIKDGFQVMRELSAQGLLVEVPVVIITAENTTDTEMEAFEMGASDIIMKPFEPHVVRKRVENIIELNLHKLNQKELIEEQAAKLRESSNKMINALSSIIEYRSVETGHHVQRIALYTRVLLDNIEKNYPSFMVNDHIKELIVRAAPMHDIGKIAIPDSILKKPGSLTKEEFEIMKTHTTQGCEMLENLEGIDDPEYLYYASRICRYHHERWDGHGYPDHLKGDEISLCAQVVGIADCYDALTSNRVYKDAIPGNKAINMILQGECGIFSPQILEVLKSVHNQFIELSMEYSDDSEKPLTSFVASKPERNENIDVEFASDSDHLKYLTMVRYLDTTIMEVDMNNGVYHLVYSGGEDFSALKKGNSFNDSINIFIKEAIHPEDGHKLLEELNNNMEHFFAQGLSNKRIKARVYNKHLGKFVDYECTIMRIDLDSPKQLKAMIIWRRATNVEHYVNEKDAYLDEELLKTMIVDVQKRRNDRKMTIEKASEGIKRLLGYNDDEFNRLFHNHYYHLIVRDDREEVYKQIHKQQLKGHMIEVEYRVKAKDGRIYWLLDKSQVIIGSDGNEYLYGVLIDITNTKTIQQELQSLSERYEILVEQTDDIIFEWDAEEDKLSYSSNWKEKFGYEPITQNASRKLGEAARVHADDLQTIRETVQSVKLGMHYIENQLRIMNGDGDYTWYKIRVTTQLDNDGHVMRAIGIISNIDEEHRASENLLKRAERDSLTDLYNKKSAFERINRYIANMEANEKAAMFIIDVDDFKLINDSYGHQFGDVVLQEVAGVLKRMFRSNDVISRIGGDEFMIFMQEVRNEKIVLDRAKLINTALHKAVSNLASDCIPTASIGVVFYPDGGTTPEELFKNCDLALYKTKYNGKDSFAIFDPNTMFTDASVPIANIAANTQIDSDSVGMRNQEPIMNIIVRKMCENEDVDAMINSILEMIGIRYDVSRVYIFKDVNHESATCEYEWHDAGVTPLIPDVQNLKYVNGGEDVRDLLDADGIIYVPNVEHLNDGLKQFMSSGGAKSVLICGIYDEHGQLTGFIGFDDNVSNRVWVTSQISSAATIAKMMPMLLEKKRSQLRTRAYTKDLRSLLDNQSAWIYVVNPDNYHFYFFNGKIKSDIKGINRGDYCYHALYGCDKPCENCPINFLTSDNQAYDYSVNLNDKHTGISASMIKWDDNDAYMIICNQPEDFKKSS